MEHYLENLGGVMRGSTKWGIGLFVVSFAFSMIGEANKPTSLSDPSFGAKIDTVNFWFALSTLTFIAMIICFGYSIYKNIMEKNVNKTHIGHKISATNSVVATDNASQNVNYASIVASDSSLLEGVGDTAALAADLAILRKHLLSNGSLEDVSTAGEIAKAEASLGNEDTKSAFASLAAAGEYALEAAVKIGAPVATAALKKAVGL